MICRHLKQKRAKLSTYDSNVVASGSMAIVVMSFFVAMTPFLVTLVFFAARWLQHFRIDIHSMHASLHATQETSAETAVGAEL